MTCQEYRNTFPEAYYGELSPEQKREFDKHLESCPGCSSEYDRMTATLRIMDTRSPIESEEQYLAGYWNRLQSKLAPAGGEAEHRNPGKRSVVLHPAAIPSWAYGIAAMLLLAAGIYLGRTFFTPPAPMEIARHVEKAPSEKAPEPFAEIPPEKNVAAPIPSPIPQNVLDKEVNSYLDRSKVLLLGLVNAQESDSSTSDFGRQQEVSRQLIRKANYLKEHLKEPDQEYLRRLIGDLEIVLLQLANYSADNGVPLIEMVKQGVDKKSILFKINLEQLRALDPDVKPHGKTAKNEQKSKI